jgi:hypothetical protein
MDIETNVERKIDRIGTKKIVKTISDKTGLSTEDVSAVFDAFKHEFPKLLKKYSPSKVGDATIFTIPHFTLEVKRVQHKTDGSMLLATPAFVKS